MSTINNNTSISKLQGAVDLGPTQSVQLQYAKLQLMLSELAKTDANENMKLIEEAMAEQEKVAAFTQQLRQIEQNAATEDQLVQLEADKQALATAEINKTTTEQNYETAMKSLQTQLNSSQILNEYLYTFPADYDITLLDLEGLKSYLPGSSAQIDQIINSSTTEAEAIATFTKELQALQASAPSAQDVKDLETAKMFLEDLTTKRAEARIFSRTEVSPELEAFMEKEGMHYEDWGRDDRLSKGELDDNIEALSRYVAHNERRLPTVSEDLVTFMKSQGIALPDDLTMLSSDDIGSMISGLSSHSPSTDYVYLPNDARTTLQTLVSSAKSSAMASIASLETSINTETNNYNASMSAYNTQISSLQSAVSAVPQNTLSPEIEQYMKDNGLAMPTDYANLTEEDIEMIMESLTAHVELLGSNTQQLMVLINDSLGQYNSYLQGANSSISQANQTLQTLARNS